MNLPEQVTNLLLTEKRINDTVIVAVGGNDFWYTRGVGMVYPDRYNATLYALGEPSRVAERLLQQMKRIFEKQYRVIATTLPPYQILPAIRSMKSLEVATKQWIIDVNQELVRRVSLHNKQQAAKDAPSQHIHLLDFNAYTQRELDRTDEKSWAKTLNMTTPFLPAAEGGENFLFYDPFHFASPWHEAIAPVVATEMQKLFR